MVENHDKIRFRTRRGIAKNKIKFPNGYPEWYLEIDCERGTCENVSPTIKNVFNILDNISGHEKELNSKTGYFDYKLTCFLIAYLMRNNYMVEFKHFANYTTGDSYFIIENLVQTKILDYLKEVA